MVEQAGADEEAAFEAVVAEGQFVAALVAAVDDEIGSRRDAGVDVAADPVQGGLVDQRPVVGLGVQAVADPQMLDAFGEPGAQPVGDLIAHGDRDADGHAALSGATVTGPDQGVDGLVEVGVGHDDHVVLGTAEALRALAVGRRVGVDVLRDI